MTSIPVSRWALVGFGLALIGLVVLLISGPGHRLGLWDFRTGLTLLRWGAYLGIAALAVSLVGAIVARPGGPQRGFGWALAGLVIAGVTVVVPLLWSYQAQQVPRIHDITTDTEDPPRFVEILPLRADAPNPAEYGGPEIAAQQRQGYPELGPAHFNHPKESVFAQALTVAQDMGWDIVATDPAAGRIEATATTFWFGFKDDVVVRVTETADGSRVDVRSVSRVGLSDVGTNAARIEAFLERLEDRIGG